MLHHLQVSADDSHHNAFGKPEDAYKPAINVVNSTFSKYLSYCTRFNPAMSVHQPIGLKTVMVPPETLTKTSLNNSQKRVKFSVFSETASATKGGKHLL